MTAETEKPPTPQGKGRILVVEDDDDTRAIIKHSLLAEGFEVLEAVDGQEALEVCRAGLPDLIVSDIMMPRLDGIEFLKIFRKEFSETFVPVLMLTALSEVQQKVHGLSSGADDYLCKPFNFRELQARAHALLRIQRLTRSLRERSRELQDANDELGRMQETLVKQERQLVAMQLAGAAAHKLGQSITLLLLQCRLLDQQLPQEGAHRGAITAIRAECEQLQKVVTSLNDVDAARTTDYVGKTTILDL